MNEELVHEIESIVIRNTNNSDKKHRHYKFDDAKIIKLINDGVSLNDLGLYGGVSTSALRSYMRSKPEVFRSTLLIISSNRHNRNGDKKERSSTNATASKYIVDDFYRLCPVCDKKFHPAISHTYKDKKGNLVCTYSCYRKCK